MCVEGDTALEWVCDHLDIRSRTPNDRSIWSSFRHVNATPADATERWLSQQGPRLVLVGVSEPNGACEGLHDQFRHHIVCLYVGGHG